MSMKSEDKKNLWFAGVVLVLMVAISGITWQIAVKDTWTKAFKEGQNDGRGQLKPVVPGMVYELRLMGVPANGDPQAYSLNNVASTDGSSGSSEASLPYGAKAGDNVVYMSSEMKFTVVPK